MPEPLPEVYSLTGRVTEEDGQTDIELRTPTEKYTIATVEDRFAPLFLAAPDLLAACKAIEQFGSSRYHDLGIDKMVKAAIAKAESHLWQSPKKA